MKRILLLTENLGSGGAERQLCGLAVMLKERGYTVRVITYVKRQFYEPLLREAGVDYRLVERAFDKRHRFGAFLSELKDFRPDVVISFLPSVNISMCVVRTVYPTRLIVSERNYTLDWSWRTKFKYRLYGMASKVVPNSHAEAENIAVHCPWLRSKIEAIPNFTDTKRFFPPSGLKRKGIFTILSVGRLTEQKNVLAYVEALAIARDKGLNFRAVWVGSHQNSAYVNRVRGLIEKYKLSEILTLHDQTDDIAEVYREADAFCLPSLFEGYPNVLCEAMASGLPVICSNIQEMPRIVTEGVNGYMFNPHDPADIARAIDLLINRKQAELKAMGDRNRRQIVANNSMEAFVEQYVRLIESSK